MAGQARAPRTRALVLSPDDGAAVAVRTVVRFHLQALAAEVEAARAGDVEAVHRLRVATRRLRAALRLFAPLIPARIADGGQRELGWLAGAIGAVRDLDVLQEMVTARGPRLEPGLRAALGPLGVLLHERRAAALAILDAALDSARCRRLLDRLSAFAETPAPRRRRERLGEVAARLVRPLLRAVSRAGRRLDIESPPAAVHRLRVRVKRLRYALETLRGFGGKPVRQLLVQLEELQDLLGALQDAATQTAWLRAVAAAGGVEPAALLPVGALIQALAKRATKQRRRSLKAWRKLQRSQLLDDVVDGLAAGRGAPLLNAAGA